MNFLKSAVASAIAQGPPFPYTFGDKVDIDESIWTLHNGTRREDNSDCSIFAFDCIANRSRLPLAKNALRKLRTLRHPGVIKILDTVETETYIYIATERLIPLRWHVRRKSLSPEAVKWGLHSVAKTIKFVNGDASSIHGNLKVGAIYTSESGEWKLGGFDVLSSVKDDESTIYTYGSLVPDSGRYAPPELAQGGWDVIKKSPHTAVDSFNYGTLIFEVFNGDYNGRDQVGQTKNIPPTMHSSYKRLCNANPKARINVGAFLDQGSRTGSFFDIPLIKLTQGIDNLGVKSPEERDAFLKDMAPIVDDFPEEFLKMKILPEMMKSVEFSGGGPAALALVLKIAAKLPNDDFDSKMVPYLVRMFGNPDRALRVCLLDGLPAMIDRLTQKIVNDKIFPQIVTGFTDATPIVREQTLKSVLVLVTKLSDRTINGELLKHLAKTANDEQPGIRTNTTICLGKLAKSLGPSTRSKVLIAAFSRSLRDPFVHARNAALMSLGATCDNFTKEDSAARILPAICPLTIDPEKLVRESANRTLDIFLQRIRKAASDMPDSLLPANEVQTGQTPRMATPQAEAGGGWTGWAISSFTNKLSAAAGEMQTANGSGNASPALGAESRPQPTRSASHLHRQALSSPPPQSSRGASPNPSSVAAEFSWPDDDGDEGGDAWGEMGDMNEDEDNGLADAWSEPAPAPKKTQPAASSTPFQDDEPDFAGWLAAQASKKGPNKPLPKGMGKPGATTAKKAVSKPAAKSTVSKKIDMKPKATEDDDGWGDGW